MKQIIIISIVLIILSCSNDDFNIAEEIIVPPISNSSPDMCNVEILDLTYISATINWGQAYDIDNDKLFYNIYLENKPEVLGLEKDQVYKIDSLKPLQKYIGFLEVTDSISTPAISKFEFTTSKYFLKFNRLYSIDGNTPAGATIKTTTNEYVMSGAIVTKYSPVLFISKLDTCGHEKWNHIFNDKPVHAPYSLTEVSDGYILTSLKSIFKFNYEGQIDWETHWTKTEDYGTGFHDLIQTEDNGYMVVGLVPAVNSTSKVTEGLLMKLDTKGKIEWEKMFGSFKRTKANIIQKISNNRYVILGTEGDDNHASPILVEINKDGEVLNYESYSDGKYNFTKQLIIHDNNYYIACNSWDSRNVSSIRILKILSNGKLVWDKSFKWGAYGSHVYDILINNLNQPVFVGHNESYGNKEALIAVLNDQGELFRKKSYSPDYMDYVWLFTYITQTQDGGYFLSGVKNYVWNSYGKEIGVWHLKVDNELE